MLRLQGWARSAWVSVAMVAFLAALAGCAAETLAPLERDQAAKAMQPAPGRALIYVYRPSVAGIDLHPALFVNRTRQGFLDAQTYFLLDAPAGKATITIDQLEPYTIDETVQAGEIKYVRITLGPGRTLRFYPAEFPKDDALPGLANCRLIRIVTL